MELVYFAPHAKAWQHEVVAGFVLAMAAYVFMAWYDYIYDCNDKLGPTLLGALIGWAKPYGGVPPGTDPLPIKYQKIVGAFDLVVLIILIGLLVTPYLPVIRLVRILNERPLLLKTNRFRTNQRGT